MPLPNSGSSVGMAFMAADELARRRRRSSLAHRPSRWAVAAYMPACMSLGIIFLRCLAWKRSRTRAWIVHVPVEAGRDQSSLRRFEAERRHFVMLSTNDTAAASRQAEFRACFTPLLRIAAGIGEGDDLGAGGLRLQQEARQIGGVQRMAGAADDLSAGRLHRLACNWREILAEGVVGGDEKPALAAGSVSVLPRPWPRRRCRRSNGRNCEHFGPVSTEAPAPDPITALFFSSAMRDTASATAEFGRSMMTSTWSSSIHLRAIAAPMSGLFW